MPVAQDRPFPSFAEIFREHAPFVWRALRHLGVPAADAEDVCQEVFVVVHRRLGDFEGRSSLRTWLYGICLRTASDHRRRARHRYEQVTARVPDERISAPQIEDLAQQEALARLDAALATLDDDTRAVFVLYEMEELTMREVAAAVDCPLQTAYSRLYRARKEIAACFSTSRDGGMEADR